MVRIKLWLIILSIGLIILDKYSFISSIRDYASIYLQKQSWLLIYRIENYPKLVLLQKIEQKKLEKENNQLKQQIEKYAIMLKQQNNQQEDEKELQELKSQSNLYNNFDIEIARAVINVNYIVNGKLLIDKGSIDGISLGNAVVNNSGVIGQIGVLNTHNSQIIMISNPDSKIYLQNQTTKSKMLAQGIGNNKLLVKYISKNDTIKEGDLLVTTGLDNIYPADLPVARIIKIFYENNGFNSALCEPAVDFNKLQFVLVLKHDN
ncbi:MAG TPA: rod shape-determining protein MreC [Burkholderiales bacterium]|mgnify:CR=1 FL=1|nr:rod shape-determining protein MreC [Burkholderiales bacterium]